MPRTELFQMDREERLEKIKAMETSALFEELDDTIQFDVLNMSNEKWLLCSDKKVYQEIIRELKRRIDGK